MVVRRPWHERVGRWVLAAALFIPAGGLLEYSGLTPLSATVIAVVVVLAIALIVSAHHPVVRASDSGLIVRDTRTGRDELLSWSEIARIEPMRDGVTIFRIHDGPIIVRLDRVDANRLARTIAANYAAAWAHRPPELIPLRERE